MEYKEYRLTITDPYWVRQVEVLKRAGIPRWIAEPACIKADRDQSSAIAYV